MQVIINFVFFIFFASVFAVGKFKEIMFKIFFYLFKKQYIFSIDRTPPYITVEPPFEKAFYAVNPDCESKIPFTLPCKAEGSPPLRFVS